MIFINNKTEEKLRNLKKEDYLYLAIVIILSGIIISFFSYSANFLSSNINKVFYSESTSVTTGLNMENYNLVVKKMNLDVQDQTNNTQSQSTSSFVNSQKLDKRDLTIKILNGTNQSGLASELETKLVSEGFTISKKGNSLNNYSTTTLIIQDNKSEYTSILLEALNKTYPKAVASTTSAASDVDAVIIIGSN